MTDFLNRNVELGGVPALKADEALSYAIFLAFDTDSNERVNEEEFMEGYKKHNTSKSPLTATDSKKFSDTLRDKLGSTLTPEEFKAVFDAAQNATFIPGDAHTDFRALSALTPLGGNGELDFLLFDQGRMSQSPAPGLARIFSRVRNNLKNMGGAPDQFIQRQVIEANLRTWLASQEARDKPGPVLVGGLILKGDRDKLRNDAFANALTLRLADTSSSLLTGGLEPRLQDEALNSAQIGFTKRRGQDSQITIDGALRLEWRRNKWLKNPDSKSLPFAAVEIIRRGAGDDLIDLRRYHLQSLFFRNHGQHSLIKASSIVTGVFYETDLAKNQNTLAYSLKWDPLIDLGPLSFGRSLKVSGIKGARYSISPSLGLEYRDVLSRLPTSTTEDSFYGSFGLKLALSLFDKRLKITQEYNHLHSFSSNNGNASNRKLTIGIPLTGKGDISLTGTMRSGRIAPGVESTKDYVVGLGAQF